MRGRRHAKNAGRNDNQVQLGTINTKTMKTTFNKWFDKNIGILFHLVCKGIKTQRKP